MKFLQALPPYFGGKQALLGTIFRVMPPPEQAPTLVDAFLGGGSVSLYAKARGYQVLCNDWAERSAVVGRGLVENGRVKLTKHDVARIMMPNGYDFCQRSEISAYFITDDAAFIDTVCGNLREMEEGIKKDLLTLALINFILRSRHHGDFGVQWTYEALRPKQNLYLPLGHMKSAKLYLTSPTDRFMREVRKINAAIFSNGKENRFNQGDVIEFLSTARADIAYFDPPYYGSPSYEHTYRVLDQILAGEEKDIQDSEFNKENAYRFIEAMLERADWAKVWVISYGGPEVDRREFLALVRKYRKTAQEVPIKYVYRFGNHSDVTGNRKTEILIVAEA